MNMDSTQPSKDWKLDLRYGRLKTPYHHYTVFAEGVAGELSEGYSCPRGPAFMGMKTWASSEEESANMIQVFAKHVGFTVTGNIQVYSTEPSKPPSENPS